MPPSGGKEVQMIGKLNEYAHLVIEVGLNVQKGQEVVINSPVDCAFFARLCARAAYDVGARRVHMLWRDDEISREYWLKAEDTVFDEVLPWDVERNLTLAKKNAAFLNISATDPENLKGVDPKRLERASKANNQANKEYYTMLMNSDFPWCVASIPIPSWAKKVFPGVPEEEAMDKLWNAIFDAVRIENCGGAVDRWRKHCAFLDEKSKKLNELNFKSLHYTNSIGTDLTIELPEGHVWEAGSESSKTGIEFVANMPTEEVFTAPKRDGVNGKVVATKPLVIDGNIVKNFYMIFKDGKIVEAHAEEGEEYLLNAIKEDENACMLGEVALVQYDSPISNSGILFYNTLFDENASCHLAFGAAYPSCLKGGTELNEEELLAKGINCSAQHCDFMVGSKDLSIIGTTHDGKNIPVFVDGNFAL